MNPSRLRRQISGATLNECGCLLVLLAAAILGGVQGWSLYGWWGILGAVVVPVTFIGLMQLSFMLALWIFGCLPDFPPCPNGCCRSPDYKPEFAGPPRDWRWKCHCGIHYRKLGPGSRRLMIVNPDNSHTPYMRYVPCLGWRNDKGPGTGPCW